MVKASDTLLWVSHREQSTLTAGTVDAPQELPVSISHHMEKPMRSVTGTELLSQCYPVLLGGGVGCWKHGTTRAKDKGLNLD